MIQMKLAKWFISRHCHTDVLFYFILLSFLSVFSDGCSFLCSKPDILTALFALTHDPSTAVVKQCYLIFVNLSADEASHQVIGLRITSMIQCDKCLKQTLTDIGSSLYDPGVG